MCAHFNCEQTEIPVGQALPRLLTTTQLNDIVKQLRGSNSNRDFEAGTWVLKAPDGRIVFKALQKGKGGAWITRLNKVFFSEG